MDPNDLTPSAGFQIGNSLYGPPPPPNWFQAWMRQSLGINPMGMASTELPFDRTDRSGTGVSNNPQMFMPVPPRPMAPEEMNPIQRGEALQGQRPIGFDTLPPQPQVAGQGQGNPMQMLLQQLQGQKVEFPTPPELKVPSVPPDPNRQAIYDFLQKPGGGVGARMPSIPNDPVPQRAPLQPIDWSGINAAYEKARPQVGKIDEKELWLTALMGAISGFADARPGERLGITLGRMAGAGAGAYSKERSNQKNQLREDEKALRAFELSLAQNKQNQAITDVNRSDRNQDIVVENGMRVYEAGQRRWQMGMQLAQLQAEISRGNASNALQRLTLLTQMSGQDRAFGLQLQQLQNEIAQGNYQNAFSRAKAMHDQNMGFANQALTMFSTIARSQAGTFGGQDPSAQLMYVVPQITGGKLTVPGLDVGAIRGEAEKMISKTLMANPQAYKAALDNTTQQLVMQRMMANPDLMQQVLRSMQKFPIGSSPFGSSSPAPVTNE